jgi:hypothetical protein
MLNVRIGRTHQKRKKPGNDPVVPMMSLVIAT